MRAVLCHEYGPPHNLVLEDVPEPELGAGLIRIRVHACGVNFPDVLMVAGQYQWQPPLPFIPGAELAGEVVEVAADAGELEAGQRVIAITQGGGMAEQVCVPHAAALPIPESLDLTVAAGFLLTYGTAYHALQDRGAVQPGEKLLVLGAAGGVGLAAVEVGTLLGAEVIAAASSPEKLELARRYGAAHCIDYSAADLKGAIRELTHGRGVDVIFDPVGGKLSDACLRSIAWGGRILVIGFASGSIQQIPANLPLLKGSSVVGVFWGRFTEQDPDRHAGNTEKLVALLAGGKLRPHISQTFPLAAAADALQELAERRAVGKIVVTI